MEYNYSVIINYESTDQIIVEIPDYLKEEPSTIYQIKEFLKDKYEIDYDNIKIEIIRNRRKLKNNNDDFEIYNNDIVSVMVVNIQKFLGIDMQTSTSVKEQKIGLSGHAIVSNENGDKYIGDIKNGKKEGKGKLEYANGWSYDGEWKNDMKNGKGKEVAPDYTYEGEWKDDKFNGQGINFEENGSFYNGEWKDGLKNGYGRSFRNYNIMPELKGIHEGIWKDNHYDGYGIGTNDNGDIFEGQWYFDKESYRLFIGKVNYINGDIYEGEIDLHLNKNGDGQMQYSNGDSFKGEWYADHKKYGKMYYINGETYEGMFHTFSKDGILKEYKNGLGRYTYIDGISIYGDWILDIYKELTYKEFPLGNPINKVNGSVEIYNGSNIYKGEIKESKMDGYGELIDKNGKYTGEWKNGRKNGHGKMIFKIEEKIKSKFRPVTEIILIKGKGPDFKSIIKNKSWRDKIISYEGEWKDDKFYFGIITFMSGNIYEGEVKYDKMSGQGRLTYSNGDISEGTFYNNEEKYCKIIYHNGNIYEGNLEGKLPRGYGIMKYANDDFYDGNWQLGQKGKQGIMLYANGDFYEGYWTFDEKKWDGKMIYANGSIFEGKWLNDEQSYGTFTDVNGRKYNKII